MNTTYAAHMITDSCTWMTNNAAIYLTPGGAGWDVNMIDMMGETVESETFATEEMAMRFIEELIKDAS